MAADEPRVQMSVTLPLSLAQVVHADAEEFEVSRSAAVVRLIRAAVQDRAPVRRDGVNRG